MNLQELTRRLREQNPELVYVITALYETIVEQQKVIDQQTSILLNVVNSMEGVLKFSTSLRQQMQLMEKIGKTEGVTVESVSAEPELDMK